MSTQPAKFANEPCSERPIANHAAHKIAINDVVWTPNIPATEINNNTLSQTLMRLLINLLTVISTFDVSRPFAISLLSRLMTRSQITRVAIPHKTVGARLAIIQVACVVYSESFSGFMS